MTLTADQPTQARTLKTATGGLLVISFSVGTKNGTAETAVASVPREEV